MAGQKAGKHTASSPSSRAADIAVDTRAGARAVMAADRVDAVERKTTFAWNAFRRAPYAAGKVPLFSNHDLTLSCLHRRRKDPFRVSVDFTEGPIREALALKNPCQVKALRAHISSGAFFA